MRAFGFCGLCHVKLAGNFLQKLRHEWCLVIRQFFHWRDLSSKTGDHPLRDVVSFGFETAMTQKTQKGGSDSTVMGSNCAKTTSGVSLKGGAFGDSWFTVYYRMIPSSNRQRSFVRCVSCSFVRSGNKTDANRISRVNYIDVTKHTYLAGVLGV